MFSEDWRLGVPLLKALLYKSKYLKSEQEFKLGIPPVVLPLDLYNKFRSAGVNVNTFVAIGAVNKLEEST